MGIAVFFSPWHFYTFLSCPGIKIKYKIFIKQSLCEVIDLDLLIAHHICLIEDKYFDSFRLSLSKELINIITSEFAKIELDTKVCFYCSDLMNPFSCIVFSFLKQKRQVDVRFLYDGTLNLVYSKQSFGAKIKEKIKALAYKAIWGFEYPLKSHHLTGLDLPFVKAQYVPEGIKPNYVRKVRYFQPLFETTPFPSQDKDVIVYVEQNIAMLNKNYGKWKNKTWKFLEVEHLTSKVFVAKHPSSKLQYENELKRYNDLLEKDILDLAPKLVVSHNSSTLINLRGLGFKGRLLALSPYEFTLQVGRSADAAASIEQLFILNDIDIIRI